MLRVYIHVLSARGPSSRYAGATDQTDLYQVQLAGSNLKSFSYQILAVANEALLEYPDQRVRSLKDVEEYLQLRVVLGGPAKSGASDPDGVGLVEWQLAIYSGAGGASAALKFIHYILEYKVRKGYVLRMPDLAVHLLTDGVPALPAPWRALTHAEAVALPKPFCALPPKGRRHVLVQLDPQEQEDGSAASAAQLEPYVLSVFGGIYHFKDRFESHRVPGALLALGDSDKKDYVRYLECSTDAAAQQRVRVLLETVLLGLPVYFINGVDSADPMALWLLAQPSVIDGEAQPEAEASPSPNAPVAAAPADVENEVVPID